MNAACRLFRRRGAAILAITVAREAVMRWIFVSLAVGVLSGCAPIGEAQYREAMEYKIKEAQQAYEGARLKGDTLGMCTGSELVSGAYSDARDPANARAWRARSTEDCTLAHKTLGSFWDETPARPLPATGTTER